MMNFSILQIRDFLCAYMGVFWSNATPVFSTVACRMTRVLKTVSGRNFAHFQHFSSNWKNAEIHLFPSDWKFGACFCRDRPGPDPLVRGCVSRDGHFWTLDFRRSVRKQVYNTWDSCKNDCHRPAPSHYVFVFRGALFREPP